MKSLGKIIILTVFAIIVNHVKASAATNDGKENDTTTNLKSNIVIFKMISAPAPASNNNKSLKKAGSVARTSNSHSTITTKALPNQG